MDSLTNSARHGPHLIIQLPVELLTAILALLTNRDVKNLRLTCKAVQDVVPLRFHRVFLSTHSRDIEVFKAVAQHDVLRHQITEIIYDDARITDPTQFEDDFEDPWLYEDDSPAPEGVPGWYNHSYKKIVETMENWRPREFQGPDHLATAAQLRDRLDVKLSWEQYQKIQRDQQQTVRTDEDTEALIFGLPRFPQLKRITLTPAAHGEDMRPLYETPMMRSLPHGFIYPVPRGWPVEIIAENVANPPPEMDPWVTEDVKNQWRGFRVVTRALASHLRQGSAKANNIAEFVVDSNYLPTGLNCQVFTEPNEEYDNLVTFLQQPGTTRLDLSLHVGGHFFSGRDFFHSDALRRAYEQAVRMEHVSLYTNIEPGFFNARTDEADALLEFWVPLRDIFPVASWSNLRHFGLVNFIVTQSDLLALLKAMPPTLQSVELSFLHFVETEGSYSEFLVDLRDELGWRQRPSGERPRITIRVMSTPGGSRRFFTCVSRETERYVYGDGESPFPAGSGHDVFLGVGHLHDAFEPDFTRPNLDPVTLMRMGVQPWSEWTRQRMIEQGMPLTMEGSASR